MINSSRINNFVGHLKRCSSALHLLCCRIKNSQYFTIKNLFFFLYFLFGVFTTFLDTIVVDILCRTHQKGLIEGQKMSMGLRDGELIIRGRSILLPLYMFTACV